MYMFRDKKTILTSLFASCLRVLTGCHADISHHISCVLSTEGHVYMQSFIGQFNDPDSEFVLKDWVHEQQTTGATRTVVIPAHVSYVTRMEMLGTKAIVTSSKDCTLKVFDMTGSGSGILLKCVMVGHEDIVNDFTLRPENKILSCSDDQTFRIWNTNTGMLEETIRLDEQIKLVESSPRDTDTVVYVSSNTAYPIVLFDMRKKTKIRRLMLGSAQVTAVLLVTDGMFISDGRKVYGMGYDGKKTTLYASDNVHNICWTDDARLVHETEKGISVDSNTVDIIEETSRMFRIAKIKLNDGKAFVLWNYGPVHKSSNLTVVDLETLGKTNYELAFMQNTFCTDIVIDGTVVYCATLTGNIYWYNIDSQDTDICEGHTFNDQVLVGLGFTNVHVATCGEGILVSNKNELRFWNNITQTSKDAILPYVALGCAYFNGMFVVISSDTVYWYNTDISYVCCKHTEWQLEKVVASSAALLLLYSDLRRTSLACFKEMSTKNLASWSNDDFQPVQNIHPNSVLFSTTNRIFLSDSQRITAISAVSFELMFKFEFSRYADGIAISGCVLDNKIYTLHTCSKVLIWMQGLTDMSVYETTSVHESVVEIKEFNCYILGFSTLGNIYIYDRRMRLQKCVVSHSARVIHGTSYKDNTAVVVSDSNGVMQILAEIFSSGGK
jgi:WD40 repeat protein